MDEIKKNKEIVFNKSFYKLQAVAVYLLVACLMVIYVESAPAMDETVEGQLGGTHVESPQDNKEICKKWLCWKLFFLFG